ncbi:MAG TPA: TSUP family transporter [Chthonomonadales bacterium]|nr:TSUP family transporter [Chthonomonadales bacterium]
MAARRKLNIPLIKSATMFAVGGPIGFGATLCGVGGQVAAAPAIDFLLGLRPERNAGTSLLFALAAAAASVAAAHVFGAPVDWLAAVLLAIGATVGVAATAAICRSPGALKVRRTAHACAVLLGVYVVAEALRQRVGGPQTLALEWLSAPAGLLLLGAVCGAASSVLQVATGLLFVPALVFLAGVPVLDSVVMANLVVAIASVLPVAGHVARGTADRQAGMWMVVGGVLGGAAGGWTLALVAVDAGVVALVWFGLVAMFLGGWQLSRLS